MKKKIKLKDITLEQYKKWHHGCDGTDCEKCPLRIAYCDPENDNHEWCWFNHKEMFSNEFLNQEIVIEVSDLLTQEEREYLEAVLKPFKNRVEYVELCHYLSCDNIRIAISIENYASVYSDLVYLPEFKKGTMYKGLEEEKQYTLEKLGLFENQEVKK